MRSIVSGRFSPRNKEKYFSIKAREMHGNKYSYKFVEYKNASTKINIKCNKHKTIFRQTPNDHLSGAGCPKCAIEKRSLLRKNTQEYFESKSSKVHNYFYDYSKAIYSSQNKKVVIICPIHGEFEQLPKQHIKGCGCIGCAKDKISRARRENPTGWKLGDWIESSIDNPEFDIYKIYIIECFDENERFIKIGRTYKKINRRFRNKNLMPYDYKVLVQIDGNPKLIYELENSLKNNYKNFKHIPMKKFNGMYECFDIKLKNILMPIAK